MRFLQLLAPCFNNLHNPLHEICHRHCCQVLIRAQADSHSILRCLLISHYEHIGNLLHLGITYFGIHALVARIYLDTHSYQLELRCDLVRVSSVPVGDRDEHDLDRGQPGREGSGIMLKQDGDHALQRAAVSAMNHHGPVTLPVLANIAQVEAFGQVVVYLGRAKLPLTAKGVEEEKVEFRPIKPRLALLNRVGKVELFNDVHNHRLRLVPRLVAAYILGTGRIAQANTGREVAEMEGAKDEELQFNDPDKLFLDLFRCKEDVRVVYREVTRAQQAVEFPALLEAIDRTKLGQAQRQIAVGAHLVLKDLDVVGAVHGLEDVSLTIWLIYRQVESCSTSQAAIMRMRPVVRFSRLSWLFCPGSMLDHGREDAVAILVPMAAGLVEFDFANMWRHYWQVAAIKLFLAQETLKRVAQDGPSG